MAQQRIQIVDGSVAGETNEEPIGEVKGWIGTTEDRNEGRPTPDLTLNLSGVFWTEVAKIHSRTKQAGSDQVLAWDDFSEFPSEGESVKCRRAAVGAPNWNGPYKEIMTALKSVTDVDDAKQTILDIIRAEQAQLRSCIEQMHSTNAALQWIAMNPANGHFQLTQLVNINHWLKCERSQVRITIQKLKSDAEQPVLEFMTADDQKSDAGAPESRSNFSTPNIIRYDVLKINRVNRNSRRVFEIDVRQHSLAIVRQETAIVSASPGSVHSQSQRRPTAMGSQRDLFSFGDDSDNVLLSNTMIIDVRLVSVPATSGKRSPSSPRAEVHIEYLTSSMRKSKIFKGLMANIAERDQFYKHICLYVLQKPNLLIAASPKNVGDTFKSTAPIGTIRASVTSRRAFSATFDARMLSRSLLPGTFVPFSDEDAPILPIRRISERAHSNWALEKLAQKWTMGKRIDLDKKMHTELVPFNELTQDAQLFKVESVRRMIDSICDFGYTIQSSEGDPAQERDTLESSDRQQLLSVLAVTLHETWIDSAVNSGWRFGSHFDEASKRHPNLTPFSCLDALVSSEYINQAQFVIGAISELGLSIQYSHRHARASSRVQSM